MNNRNLSTGFYREAAAKAATLSERITEPHRFALLKTDSPHTGQRINTWLETVAAGDPAIFEKRLSLDGLTRNDLNRLLGDVAFASDDHLPAWIDQFGQLMEFLSTCSFVSDEAEMQHLFGEGEDKKIPFLHLIAPIVNFAVSRVNLAAGDPLHALFAPAALHRMQCQLANLLSWYARQTFQLEFQLFRLKNQSAFSKLISEVISAQEPENQLYRQFVSGILRDGWIRFFGEYSSLARIVTTLTFNWINNTTEFVQRLERDYDEIAGHFGANATPGLLTEYQGGASDTHNQGKSVVLLTFESGLKLVYKPKNTELEQVWSEFINWFNSTGLQPNLKPLDVINKGSYGWVGFVEFAECASKSEVSEYYRRIGSLIGIVFMLHGNDFHQENLIASGAYPVPVDLESVMHHEGKTVVDGFGENARFLLSSHFRNSVLRTALLPAWVEAKNGVLFDVSGIGGAGQGESPYQHLKWENINTDTMKTSLVTSGFTENKNIPVFDGQKQMPEAFANEIIEGFTSFYRHVLLHKNQVPVHLFKGKELRFIFRATRVYSLINKSMLNPKFMRLGIDRSIQLELLGRAFLHDRVLGSCWPVFRSEVMQMEACDIPIFLSVSDLPAIADNSGIILNDFTQGIVYDEVVARLQAFCENDLAQQLRFIRASLFFREAVHNPGTVKTQNRNTDFDSAEPVTQEDLLKTALDIGRIFRKEAIFSENGTCTWITAGVVAGSDRFRLEPMSPFLYDGISGVTLFLSALGAITRDAEIVGMNEATLKSFRQEIKNILGNNGFFPYSYIGITSGIPSMIYALLKISHFLNDHSFVDDAVSLQEHVTPALIKKDTFFDIISGSAGCILAMLALHRQTGSSEPLEKARLCGEHLLLNVTENADGTKGWKTIGGTMLTGFSHGQAGIAHALLKLFEVTGDERYRQAALQAIDYENGLFSEKHQNWPDLRPRNQEQPGEQEFMKAWCHGAPGIGMARLATSHLTNNACHEKYIAAATHTLLTTPVTGNDHLCCGNLGRVEMLLQNALKSGDTGLLSTVYQKAAQVMQRASANGHFTLFTDDIGDFFNPGFFQGMSGVGYEILRLAYPVKVPSVLAFE